MQPCLGYLTQLLSWYEWKSCQQWFALCGYYIGGIGTETCTHYKFTGLTICLWTQLSDRAFSLQVKMLLVSILGILHLYPTHTKRTSLHFGCDFPLLIFSWKQVQWCVKWSFYFHPVPLYDWYFQFPQLKLVQYCRFVLYPSDHFIEYYTSAVISPFYWLWSHEISTLQ